MNRKIKLFIASLAVLVCASFGVGVCNQVYAKVYTDDVTLSNIEAFGSSRSLDCSYKRTQSECSIKMTAGAKVDIFGIGITSPKADATVWIDGVVICSANGENACTPIECAELYKIIRK